MRIIYGVEAHIQGTWAMIKSDKRLYTFYQRRNTKNYDYMKQFDAYVKVIEYYGRRKPIHPGPGKANITKMGVQDTKNTTPE